MTNPITSPGYENLNKQDLAAFGDSKPFRTESQNGFSSAHDLRLRKIIYSKRNLPPDREDHIFDLTKFDKLGPVLFNAIKNQKNPDINSIINAGFNDEQSEKIFEITNEYLRWHGTIDVDGQVGSLKFYILEQVFWKNGRMC